MTASEQIDEEMDAAKERLALLYGEKVAELAISIFDRVVAVDAMAEARRAGVRSGMLLAALLALFRAFEQAADGCASRYSKN